jgi:uncharacterized phage protein gp47/JayE
MALDLELQSYEEILDGMIRSLQSRVGLSDDTIGSVTLSLLETAAQSDFLVNSNILAALDSISIDRATGVTLDKIGFSEGLTRIPATKASGPITITDASFTKVSTQIYPNRPPPISGATIIYVNDASSFPSTGQLYIGRETAQVEGPITYSAIAQVGSYYQITLSTSLNKNHNTGESIILAQGGNRSIQSGASIQTPASGASAQILFNTISNAIIPDGETTITGVSALCSETGAAGNIPANTLTAFINAPFPNAVVTNPSPFSNATDIETDFQFRERIKQTRQARSRGTNVALINAVLNLIATDEQKRVSSAAIEEAATVTLPTILRIDDGTAYEPIFGGIGNEIILDSALGGEDTLQLNSTPVVKAQITTINVQPFEIYDDYKLSVLVGGALSEHVFQADDFRSEGAATAYEIVASINANTDLLFSARTASGANKVTIFAKSDSNEDIEVTVPDSGTDANTYLAFPQSHQYTVLLYKNDELLTKDGSEATIESTAYPWNLSLTSYTFIVSVDGTPNATYTFNSSNLAPYTPSNAPLSQWVTAFNSTIPGITAISSNNLLVISSNKGANSEALLSISSSCTLVSLGGVFSDLEAEGRNSDYSLIRGTGQIKLAQPATAGDNFKAGTQNFQAYFETDAISGGSFNLSATGNFWFVTDNESTFITTTLVVGSSISTSNPATNTWRFQASDNSFDNVQVGDWAIVWDESLSSSNCGFWRISNVSTSTIDVQKASGVSQSASLTNSNSFTIIRTDGIVQQGFLPSGSYSLDGAVTSLNNNLIGATASVVNANKIRISTNTYLSNGFICLASADTNGQVIGFSTFLTKTNGVQHIAAIESGNSELGSPVFSSALVANANSTASTKVFTANAAQTISPDKMLFFVQPLSITSYNNNRFNQVGIRNLVSNSTSITLSDKLTISSILINDRAYVTNGYDFSFDDKLNIVLDDNAEINTLVLPLYREIEVDSSPSPTVNTFSATDIDGGSLSLTATFGATFDFNNYRLWSRARQVVNSNGTNNDLVIRSSHFGPTGNEYRFSIQYPTAASQSATCSTAVTNGTIDNILTLPSGAEISLNTSGVTNLSITIIGSNPYQMYINTPTGTAPDYVDSGVVVGNLLRIKNTNTSFSVGNTGVFLITAVSNTAITVSNWGYNGVPTNQSVTLNDITDFIIYPVDTFSANTAISTINNGILAQNITASLVSGETGASPIFTSTNDNSGSTSLYLNLVDGENWVKNATLTASPQFTSEANFSLTSASYSLVGERFRLIPYTAQQTAEFLSSKAVSGINNIAGLKQNEQGNKIQINSQQFGTLGAVKAASGSANAVGGSIVGSASTITNNNLLIRSTIGATDGLHGGSWIQISSALPLNKTLDFASNTTLQVSHTLNLQIVSGTGSFNTAISSSADNTTNIRVEKIGKFIAYAHNSGTSPAFNGYEGAWVEISSSSNFNTENTGTFRVIRCNSSTFWIENEDGAEEVVALTGNNDIKFYSSDSVMPGDSIVISGGLMGANNDGTFVVSSVSAASLTVSALTPFVATTAPITLGSNYTNFASFDADTTNFYKQVNTLQDVSSITSSLSDILVEAGTASFDNKISDVYECTFTALNKLDFDTKTFFGVDSYLAYEGLIKEATKIIYGDTSNPNTYPGVKAAGAYIDIQPPLPRKITLSVGVRLRTGVTFKTIENNIKSVAAGVINSTSIGQSISISDIVGAIRGIQGIFAVSMISPTYNSENDLIVINAGEKPICDASTDISVTLLGG